MLLFTVFITLVISIISYVCYVIYYKKYKDIEKIPGPPVKPLVGNILEFGNNIVDTFENTVRIIKTYGRLVRIWKGPFRLNLILTDPDQVEVFLSSNVHLKKSVDYDGFIPWLGQGLINSNGDTWRKQRKLLTPAFHFKILEQFSDTFHHFSRTLIELLKKENGKNVDIYKYITMYAMDVICESSMRVNAQIQENWDKTYINATKAYMEIHIKRFFNIFNHYDFLFNLTREYKIRQKCVDTLHSFTKGVIQRRKKERKVAVGEETTDDFGIKKKKAFLDILLESKELTDEEIREEVDTFIFAGHDTVSSALSFGLFEIAQDRDIQNNILEEIESVVGPDKNEKITLQNLNNMNYLDRVMKEVLRKYPAVPFIERELTEDVILDGLNIPKSTTLTFHIYAQHHDAKLFPDPEHFDPDRFLPENTLKRHPFAYIPFSGGPRNCIGQRYAMMNCKTTIANIVRNFEISSTEPVHVPILGNDVVMKSINGLFIHLKIRK